MKIFAGRSNLPLSDAICGNIGIEPGKISLTAFPDGETFAKIEETVRGEDVFVIQSTCPPTNHHLMELFIIMDALKRASADRITAVLPFYGYARQDRKDQPRVPISATVMFVKYFTQVGEAQDILKILLMIKAGVRLFLNKIKSPQLLNQ